MPAQLSAANSRFRLESHTKDGTFVAALPYKNLQGEWMLCSAGAQLRGEIPFRGYKQVTLANFYAGKHEVWLYDNEVSRTDPIFGGPVWDITPSSDGTLSFSAQDALSYLAKRRLRQFKAYTAKTGAFMMDDLIAYMNAQHAANITSSIEVDNTQTSNQTYLSVDRNKISDLLAQISDLNDGTDYYFRVAGGVHHLYLYGGRIKPSSSKPFALDYGGNMDGYSAQYNAQGIANLFEVVGSNGLVGSAQDTTKWTEYGALYMDADNGDQNSTTSLNSTAAIRLKDTKSTKVIPTMVTRKLTPIKDFDFGDQFQVNVDDWYTQLNQVIRVIGWQLTIGQGDKTTTVIYSKDTEGVA